MAKIDNEIEKQVEVFRDVCVKMYEASDLVEFTKTDTIIYGDNYAKVVQMILPTKYGELIQEGCTLAEVGYIMFLTRERIRQTQDLCIGRPARKGEKKKIGKIGVIRNMSKVQHELFKGLKDSMRD